MSPSFDKDTRSLGVHQSSPTQLKPGTPIHDNQRKSVIITIKFTYTLQQGSATHDTRANCGTRENFSWHAKRFEPFSDIYFRSATNILQLNKK